MLINGMQGLGDNIYQRAFIARYTRPLQLKTPWPQLYADLPHVSFVQPATKLRTQSKNVFKLSVWQPQRVGTPSLNVRYGATGIVRGMTMCFGFEPGDFTLPDFGARLIDRPYVLVRPVTVRSEWRADSRNPLPEYVAEAAQAFAERGYTVVSVADLVEGVEWALDPLPPAHIRYHAGELEIAQLLNLVSHAAAVIGGVGWIVPAAIASKTPAWIVCGGQGGYNAPELICPRGHDVTFAVPDNFCRCTSRDHKCDKRIYDYRHNFAAWFHRYAAVV